MKKTIFLSLFVCVAMSLSAHAQSDNAAMVLKISDEVYDIQIQTDEGVSYSGWAQLVFTSSGVLNAIATDMKRIEGDFEYEKTTTIRFKTEGGKLNCVIRPDDTAACKYQPRF